MTTTPSPDQDRTWCHALEELQTILGAFSGLRLLLLQQDEHLDTYALARVAMIIEVLTARFEVLLDTAIGGAAEVIRRQSAPCAPAAAPHKAEGEGA